MSNNASLPTSADPVTAPSTDSPRTLRISTRSSILALAQTTLFADLLRNHPSPQISSIVTTVHPSTTSLGDLDKTTDLHALANRAESAGKNLWTEDLEQALFAGKVDVIVHSLKDVPTTLPAGFRVAAVGKREEPRDCLVLPLRSSQEAGSEDQSLSNPTTRIQIKTATEILDVLPQGAVVGTSSVRRQAFLRRKWPHLKVESVRGNVPTRLRKLDESRPFPVPPPAAAQPKVEGEIRQSEQQQEQGQNSDTRRPATHPSKGHDTTNTTTTSSTASSENPSKNPVVHYDALILAAAGVQRLNLGHRISAFLGPEDGFPHAVGQGALGLEWRTDDVWVSELVEALSDVAASTIPETGGGSNGPTFETADSEQKGSIGGRETRNECAAERALLRELEGGCSVPVGVAVQWSPPPPPPSPHQTPILTLTGTVCSPAGTRSAEATASASVGSEVDAEKLGREVAAKLIAEGAEEILKEIRH